MPKRYSRNCNRCGLPYRGQGREFCSISCRTTWRNLHGNPAQQPAARAKIAEARRGKPTTLGLACPPEKRRKIAQSLTGRTLSPEHRTAIAAGLQRLPLEKRSRPPQNTHLVGPAHPNWRGGHSPARAYDYRTLEYRAWRTAVLSRDDWTCQDCHCRGGKLHAHHLQPWGPHPELRYVVENGVTLCPPCHKTRHRGVPRPVTVDGRTLVERRSGQPVVR
mgnify:CR=1 FL=1